MLPKQSGKLFSNGVRTRGIWDSPEKLQHINVAELKAVHLAVPSFLKGKSIKAVHLQINMCLLTYLLKMGETQNQKALRIAKIWIFLIEQKHINYSRAFAKHMENCSRPRVSDENGFITMEASQKVQKFLKGCVKE